MFFLPNNHQQASALFRGLLMIAFMVWLTSVVMQYYLNDSPRKQDLAKQKVPSQLSIEPLPLPPLPKLTQQIQTKAKQTKLKITKLDSAIKAKPQARLAEPLPVSSIAKTQQIEQIEQIEQVYQQLSAQGIDIQLAWPQNSNQRQAVFDFMYQCVGVQFAVIKDNNITQIKQSSLSKYSDWIRVAQGNLSIKEQHWLNAYALTGTPIRLFPRNIDWRLANYLVKELKDNPLVSLRATYQVIHQQLHLTDIRLNNQNITDSWTIFQGKC